MRGWEEENGRQVNHSRLKMRQIFLLYILVGSLEAYSQDTAKIRQIDQLVNAINNSKFQTQIDSTIQDLPQLKLWMKTYLIAVTDSTQLKKYTNKVFAKREENGVLKEMKTNSSFYFDQGKLIKVEESIVEGGED